MWVGQVGVEACNVGGAGGCGSLYCSLGMST